MLSSSTLYAAIDLGSNSFHMLVVREVAGSIQTLARIKRKVRLAAGLDQNNHLSHEAMQRGWQCLRLFSERLQDIPREQIRVVATATLRLASNADEFLQAAEQILGCPVQVISGEEEARLIYHGVAHTTGGPDRRLVVDIGGGSTELVTGTGAQASQLYSLSMGCVTWLERYFSDRNLGQENFERAEQAAREMVRPIAPQLRQQGWQICVGASGTVQALQEIMVAQGMDERITLPKLRQLKQRAIQCGKLEELEIEGLTLERALVFPSGLSILLAIFQELGIESMMLAGGALREGLVYGMLHLPVEQDIRIRTIRNLQRRYLIDTEQAERVSQLAANFAAGRQRVAAGCAMSRAVAQRQSDPRTRPQRRFQAGAATRRLPDPPSGLTRLYPGAEKTAGHPAAKPEQPPRPVAVEPAKRPAAAHCAASVPHFAPGDHLRQPPPR